MNNFQLELAHVQHFLDSEAYDKAMSASMVTGICVDICGLKEIDAAATHRLMTAAKAIKANTGFANYLETIVNTRLLHHGAPAGDTTIDHQLLAHHLAFFTTCDWIKLGHPHAIPDMTILVLREWV